MKKVLPFILIILMISGCSACNEAQEWLRKPAASASIGDILILGIIIAFIRREI